MFRTITTLISLALLLVLSSCGEQLQSDASLASITTVTRSLQDEGKGTGDYLYTIMEPEFHPDSLIYTVLVDSNYYLGVKPAATSQEASVKLLVAGEQVQSEKWSDTEEFFTCKYEPGQEEKTIVITVTAEDGKSEKTYMIRVVFNEVANVISGQCLLDSLPMVKGISELTVFGWRMGNYYRVTTEPVQPFPVFKPSHFSYTVHVGDAKHYFFRVNSLYQYQWISIQSSGSLTSARVYYDDETYPLDNTYILDRRYDVAATDSILLTFKPDSCQNPTVYRITVKP